MAFIADKPKSKFIPDNPTQDMKQRSEEFGSIKKTPTVLEKIGSNLTSPKTRPLGLTGGLGVGLSAAGIPEEDILPAVGQGIGGMASGFTGSGFLGATGGATVGQGARQVFKALRGEKPDLSALPKEALTTGLIEGATRGAGNFVFRRQVANEALGNLSKKLNEMKDALSANPNLKAPTHELYAHITDAFDALPEPMKTGKVAQKLKSWTKYMSTRSGLSAKDLINMEADLGKAASYGEMSHGAFIPATEIPNAATNKIARGARTEVSDIVDKLAESNGQKGFAKTSKDISKLLKDPNKTDVTKATGGFGQRLVASGAVGAATHNPIAGAATYLGMQALQSPELRNAAFKALRSPIGSSVDTGTKLALAELARRINQ